MDKTKKALKKIKNHVETNKAAYAMSVVAIAAIAFQQHGRIAFYKFLEEKVIDPEEFYCSEYYEEKRVAKDLMNKGLQA
jgi:hypothetical protein